MKICLPLLFYIRYFENITARDWSPLLQGRRFWDISDILEFKCTLFMSMYVQIKMIVTRFMKIFQLEFKILVVENRPKKAVFNGWPPLMCGLQVNYHIAHNTIQIISISTRPRLLNSVPRIRSSKMAKISLYLVDGPLNVRPLGQISYIPLRNSDDFQPNKPSYVKLGPIVNENTQS